LSNFLLRYSFDFLHRRGFDQGLIFSHAVSGPSRRPQKAS
jgi:hypothetical protein